MEKHAIALLEAAGISAAAASCDNDDGDERMMSNDNKKSLLVKNQMDAWLSLKDEDNSDNNDNNNDDDMIMMDMLTAEDCAPLSIECFQHFGRLLRTAWQPTSSAVVESEFDNSSNNSIPLPPGTAASTKGSSSNNSNAHAHANSSSSSATTATTTTTAQQSDAAFLQWLSYQNRNLLMERAAEIDGDDNAVVVTLADAWDAVRATQWLRAFLELRLVVENDNEEENAVEEEPAMVNARLLLGQQAKTSSSRAHHDVLPIDGGGDDHNNPDSMMENDEDDSSKEQQHQQQQSQQEHQQSQQKQNQEFALIQALYHHMQQLPILQSHMHQYTKSLQQQQKRSTSNRHLQHRNATTITASGMIVNSNNNNNKKSTNTTSPPQHEEEVLNGTSSSSLRSKTTTTTTTTSDRLAQYQHAQQVSARLLKEWDQHIQRLQEICIIFYRCSSVAGRKLTRTRLARVWTDYLGSNSSTSSSSSSLRQENTQAAGISITLRVLERILMGIGSTSSRHDHKQDDDSSSSSDAASSLLLPSHEHLLLQQLIPLHQPNTLVLWRDQTPVLQLYHEPLTQCIGILLQKEGNSSSGSNKKKSRCGRRQSFDLFCATLQALCQPDVFPLAGNSTKQVLLLHEIDTFLSLIIDAKNNNKKNNKSQNSDENGNAITDADNNNNDEWVQQLIRHRSASSSSSTWWTDLLKVLARCMSCENSLVSERALQFCKNASFLLLVRHDADQACDILLPALVRAKRNGSGNDDDDVSWNPTVRKMTYLTLKRLRETISPETFERACNRVFGGSGQSSSAASEPEAAAASSSSSTVLRASSASTSATSANHLAANGGGDKISSSAPIRIDTSLKAGMGSWRPPSAKQPSVSISSSSSSSAGPSGSLTGVGESSSSDSVGGIRPRQPRVPGSMMPPPTNRPPSSGRGRGVTPGRGVAPWATSSSSSSSSTGRGGAQPPVTITGVAPWAMQRQPPPSIPLKPTTTGEQSLTSGVGKQQPPVTITGVAPWAVQSQPPQLSPHTAHKRRAQEAQLGGITEAPSAAKEMDEIGEDKDVSMAGNDPSGYERVLAYMEKLKPEEEEEGVSSWSQMQMAETPTLLPNLKFHDLVFGHDLGAGAFGSVRYARLIDRAKTRSHWPEYAVKVISTEKIRALGYESSVQREIAVLRILSHPGIARLISSFRFREGAYLVLEYASGGDLHALLRKHGSLDQDSTRFVVGECCAALASIHEAGLLYGDLKPENILITESGHLKLTDFGGCRPVTQRARELIQSIAKNVLKDLRDGDWKTSAAKATTGDAMTKGSNMEEEDTQGRDIVQDPEEEEEEDIRVEGTTAYLPPEVVLGAYPTMAADSWALGCVMFQCLSGRPPLLEADDAATRNRIVSFHVQDSSTEVERLFQGKHAAGITVEARDLIENLLERDAGCRPGMSQVAQHNFFMATNSTNSDATTMDVFSLHKQPAYPLDVGDVSPSPDSDKWARRQYSSIWAPQPAAYNMALQSASNGTDRSKAAALGGSVSAPIAEGDEASGFFMVTTTSARTSSSSRKPSSVSLQKMSIAGRTSARAPVLPPTPETSSQTG